MELFSLLAKLTLDSKQYQDALDEAQDAADSFESPDDQKLELNNTEYKDELKEAEGASDEFSTSVSSIFKELKGVLAGLGIAAVVTGIVTQLKEGVNLAKEHGDMIDKQSKKMNLSAKAYQEWSYALELNGASIDDLNRGMRTWQASIGDESKMKDLGAAFEAIGIDAEGAFEKIKSGENLDSLLNDTIMGLAKMSPGERGLIGKTLFGNNWNQLNPLLENSAETIADLKKEAEDLGLIMTDEEVANAAAYTDAVTRLEGALNGIKEAFAADLLPALTDAANTVAKIVAFFNPRNNKGSLSDQWANDDKALSDELVTIEGTAAAAESLADKLLKMGDTSQMTAEQYAIWKGTAEELIGLVPSLGEVIDTETGQIEGNSESIRANIKEWERLAKAKALQELKEKKLKDIYEKNSDLIDKQIEVNKKAAKAEEARVKAEHKFSDTMKQYGLGELDFTGDVAQQISDVMDKVAEMGDAGEDVSLALGLALSEYGQANLDLMKAQNDAIKVQEDLAKGEAEYAEWEKAADQYLGELGEAADSVSESASGVGDGLDKTADSADAAAEKVKELQKFLNGLEDKSITINADVNVPFWSKLAGFFSNAKGNWSVPYDNFPALLHRDEMVLTKSQARQFREGGSGGSPDGSAIADAVTAAMSKVFVMLNGDKVGDLTTRRINKNINASSYSKLRAKGG